MKKKQFLWLSAIVLSGASSPLMAQTTKTKDDKRHGKYSTPEEKAFHHKLHITSQEHTPRSLGKWHMLKEAWDPSVDLITLGHPVNTGIYSTGYWITYQDITPAEHKQAYDSIQKAMKGLDYRIVADSVGAFLARHTCTIHIDYNATQLPLHFFKGDIKIAAPKAPFTYWISSGNAKGTNQDHGPRRYQATLLGMGPHKQPAIYYYDPESADKNGYALAESIRNNKKHPFSIQTIDILIEAPFEVAELFMREMDLRGLNDLIGTPLVTGP